MNLLKRMIWELSLCYYFRLIFEKTQSYQLRICKYQHLWVTNFFITSWSRELIISCSTGNRFALCWEVNQALLEKVSRCRDYHWVSPACLSSLMKTTYISTIFIAQLYRYLISLWNDLRIYVTVYRKTRHNAGTFEFFFFALTELSTSRY